MKHICYKWIKMANFKVDTLSQKVLSAHLFVHLSIHPDGYSLSPHLSSSSQSVNQFVSQSASRSVSQSVRLSIYLSACLMCTMYLRHCSLALQSVIFHRKSAELSVIDLHSHWDQLWIESVLIELNNKDK